MFVAGRAESLPPATPDLALRVSSPPPQRGATAAAARDANPSGGGDSGGLWIETTAATERLRTPLHLDLDSLNLTLENFDIPK